ncbi:DNA mismatch repair protein MLH3 [Coniochaeta hoffmannii]|uniref:DNA mismatch repair protein MLH3 n=1 Tax=Coniochaeta hoffmannii TaxID=91930 RepID=A0AA38RCA0_9PEZI|nr:DNA mismatch repair protein MLH3 [Coniochaeta hoffmannii]
MSIKQLPSDVAAQIQSSIAIASLNSVILGLVRNSLDAQSFKINISVDYRRGNCSVEDDGLGIAPAEFLESGGLGKLHYTSKYPPDRGHYGRHGAFLASVATLSLLSITSHHHEHRSHNSLVIHNSNILARNTPAPPEQRLLAFPHGTRVTVRDLFGSMPVRVKQRGLEMEKPGPAREFERLVLNIVGILLVWPDKVSVTIRDATSSHALFLRTKDTEDDNDGSILLRRTPRLLAQAALYDDSNADSWVEVGARGFGVCVSGSVSLLPTATKRLQFIAIGIELLSNDHFANVLYEEVNNVFANSAFGVIEGESDDGAPNKKEKRTSFRIKELKARKGIDRWPIFALQIRFEERPSSQAPVVEEILDGRSSDLAIITNLLRALAYQFLKNHHFRPKPPAQLQRRPLMDSAGKLLRKPFNDDMSQPHKKPPAWIREMQSDWENPAYAAKEAPIPRIPDPVEAAALPITGGASHNCGHPRVGDASESPMMHFTGRVSKQALRDAEVIAQVDSKFILIKLALQPAGHTMPDEGEMSTTDSGELLVLIDQHAADERCRVEELQKGYFASANAELGAHTQQLEKPVQFELPRQEGLLLARFREHFEYWGIVYEVQYADASDSGGAGPTKAKVQVRSLPPSILERCRLEPRLLIELVRKEAWKLRDGPEMANSAGSGPTKVSEDGESDWVWRFHGCPQGILDLINSRSCRSAIMFNDQLSREECQELVSRLAQCVFPFQCAHGRRSMVPLVDLGCWTALESSAGDDRGVLV